LLNTPGAGVVTSAEHFQTPNSRYSKSQKAYAESCRETTDTDSISPKDFRNNEQLLCGLEFMGKKRDTFTLNRQSYGFQILAERCADMAR
jgi:hypothetical protein